MNPNDASQKNSSRREFVKQTGLLAGGLIAAPLLSNANYFSGADDTIKIALVGCGGRGTGAATQALSTTQNVKLVAMCDAFRDNLDACYKNLTGDDADTGKASAIKGRVDVPESRKFTGFDGYKKAIALADVVILATLRVSAQCILKKPLTRTSMCLWKNRWQQILPAFKKF